MIVVCESTTVFPEVYDSLMGVFSTYCNTPSESYVGIVFTRDNHIRQGEELWATMVWSRWAFM